MREGNLKIGFPDEIEVTKFDDPSEHGLSYMKAVDFVVCLPDRVFFVEFKDPQHPHARGRDANAFVEAFCSGGIDRDPIYKCRDSWVYKWSESGGALADKPVWYWVLVAHNDISGRVLSRRAKALRRELAARAVSGRRWKRSIVEDCMVFNIKTWNERFPQFPVRRLPA